MKTSNNSIVFLGLAFLASSSLFADWTYDPVNTDNNTKTADFYIPEGDFLIDTTDGSLMVQPGKLYNQQSGNTVIRGGNTSTSNSAYSLSIKNSTGGNDYIQNRSVMTFENVNVTASWIYNETNTAVLNIVGKVNTSGMNISSKLGSSLIIKSGSNFEANEFNLENTVLKIENGVANSLKNNWEFKTTAETVISIGLSNDSLASIDAATGIMQTQYTKQLNGKIELDLSNFVLDTDFVLGNEYTIVLVNSRSGQNAAGQFDDTWLVDGANVINGEFAEFVGYEKNGNTLSVTIRAIPEPAAYSALFGALAIAFAAYKRKKI